MSSATTNAKTANLLQDAYDLSDDKIKELYGETLFKEAEYDIATNGDITVTFAKPDLSSLPYDANTFQQVDFGTKNTDEYFTNAASQKAYKVPSSQGGKKDASDLTTDFLKDVFNITTDYTATDASGKALYSYTYGSGKLSIYKNIELNPTTTSGRPIADIYTAGSSADISQYFGTSSSAADTLHTVIENWASTAGNDISKLSYTYSASGELTITQKVTQPADNYTDEAQLTGVVSADATVLDGKLVKGTDGYTTYADVLAIAQDTTPTYSAEEIATAQAVVDKMDDIYATLGTTTTAADVSGLSFKFGTLTGTPAIVVKYPSTEEVEKGFPDAALSSTTYVARAVEYDKAYVSDYTKTTPSYVYQNRSTYGTSYYVLDNALTRDDVTATNINADFLKAVFAGKSADIQDFRVEFYSTDHTKVATKSAISLAVPAGLIEKAAPYTTDLYWSLQAVPGNDWDGNTSAVTPAP